MFSWLSRWLCQHHRTKFVRNIHGDEIIQLGYKRSEWRCLECGSKVLKDDLQPVAHTKFFPG